MRQLPARRCENVGAPFERATIVTALPGPHIDLVGHSGLILAVPVTTPPSTPRATSRTTFANYLKSPLESPPELKTWVSGTDYVGAKADLIENFGWEMALPNA